MKFASLATKIVIGSLLLVPAAALAQKSEGNGKRISAARSHQQEGRLKRVKILKVKKNTRHKIKKNDDEMKNASSTLARLKPHKKESDEKGEKNENEHEGNGDGRFSTSTPSVTVQTSASISSSTSAVQEIKVVSSDWSFSPNVITVKKGTTLRVHFTAVDNEHGFAIDEYNLDVQAAPGQTKTFDFVADKAGTFTIYCSVPCGSGHRDMKATLVVTA